MGAVMSKFERAFVLWALGYLAMYLVVAISFAVLLPADRFRWLIPFHVLGIVQNLVALALTIRDLYLRPFPDPNSKLTWMLLIHWTGGIGWVIYVFRHAIKPRPLISAA